MSSDYPYPKNTLKIKGLSVNRTYGGRRYLTAEAKQFKITVNRMLQVSQINWTIPAGDLTVKYQFGISRDQDVDNMIKILQDVLSHFFLFDDKRIRSVFAEKCKVAKGEEFIKFEILPFRHFESI